MTTATNPMEPPRTTPRRATDPTSATPSLRRIVGDVCATHGEIVHAGDLHVTQNVREGASVSATGSITVDGDVERAQVKAGGALVIGGAIVGGGGGKNICSSRASIRCGAARNANVRADGDVVALGDLVDSRVIAGRSLLAPGYRVVGGYVTVNGRLEVGTLGDPTGTRTVVEGGIDERLRRLGSFRAGEILANHRRVAELRAKTGPLMDGRPLTVEEKELVTEMLFETSETVEKNETLVRDLRRVAQAIHANRRNEIAVSGVVHPGVLVRFEGLEAAIAHALAGPLVLSPDPTDASLSIICSRAQALPVTRLETAPFIDALLNDLAAAMA